jgi:hypothetical protein
MVSIAEADRIRSERLRESRLRAAETRKRRSEAAALRLQRGLPKAAAELIEQSGL